MDQLPEKLTIDSNCKASKADEEYEYWKKSVELYIDRREKNGEVVDKYHIVFLCLSPSIYQKVKRHNTYEGIIEALDNLYLTEKVELFLYKIKTIDDKGKRLDIWHSEIAVFGKLYTFNSTNGVEVSYSLNALKYLFNRCILSGK